MVGVIVFLRLLWAAIYRNRVIIFRSLLPLFLILLTQVFIILLGIYWLKTGRFEPIISADAISITNIRDVIFNIVVPAITFIAISVVIVVIIGLALKHITGATRGKIRETYAKQYFVSCKQKWPWYSTPARQQELSSDLQPYKYKEVLKGQIRLLKVFRLGQAKRFECQLVHVPLQSEGMKYLAVSYRWGDPTKAKVFFENNQYLNISESVDIILNTLLDPGKSIHLWIDSLCINQSDDKEKSEQVMLMREIYSYAEQVVIILGKATSGTDRAMECIIPFAKAFMNTSRGRYGSSLASGTESFDLAMAGIDLSKETWTAFGELLCRPWWNRVWVIQEAVVGSKPIFVCGDRAVEWDVMVYVINEVLLHGPLARLLATNIDQYDLGNSNPINAATHLIQMSAARYQVQSEEYPSFQDTLMEMVGYDATDPNDRIYGLLGLSCDRDDAELIPNYEMPVRESYIQTARHLVTCHGSVVILHRAGIENSRHLEDKKLNAVYLLPSWVPDWRSRPASEDSLCFGKGWAKYRASGNYSVQACCPSGKPNSKPSDERGNKSKWESIDVTVTLRGVIIDAVCEASTLKQEKERKLQESKQLYSALQPAGKVFASRFLDLEDERKIAIQWIGDHQLLMKKSRLSSQSEAALSLAKMPSHWKTEYERTVTAAELGTTEPSTELATLWDRAQDHFGKPVNSSSKLPPPDFTKAEETTLFHRRFMTATKNRRFFTTRDKRIGIGSRETKSGDIVVIFLGGSTPFVIREVNGLSVDGDQGRKQYRLVGEAYVNGLMAGEGVENLGEREEAVVKITLR